MSYKVDYYTLALMSDGTTGNIAQGQGTVYTDANLASIPVILDDHLKPGERVGVITKIEKVEGECIFK